MAEAAQTPTAPTPVMDVVAPPVEKKPETAVGETDPLDKLVAEAQREQQPAAGHSAEKHHKPAQQQAPAKHNEQGQHGVGAAITATVIIVLALAALATYAYVQTNK